MHNQLTYITEAVTMWAAVLGDADQLADTNQDTDNGFTPFDEIRVRLPSMLASFSPAARAAMRVQLDHVVEVVAFTQSLVRIFDHTNASA